MKAYVCEKNKHGVSKYYNGRVRSAVIVARIDRWARVTSRDAVSVTETAQVWVNEADGVTEGNYLGIVVDMEEAVVDLTWKEVWMNSLVNRIRLGRRRAALSQSELATKVGVQRTAVAQWERKGGSRPTVGNLSKLAVELKVAFEWLATGRGRMELAIDDDGDRPVAIDLDWYAHDALEQRLLAAHREVPYPVNLRLVELVESMSLSLVK